MTQALIIDGELADPFAAQASLAGASQALGEAWFETIRVTAGVPELLTAHLDRLANTIELDREAVTTELARAIDLAGGEDLHARIVVGLAGRIVSAAALPERAIFDDPLKLTIADVPDYSFPSKLAEYEPHATLLTEARESGADDVLISDASIVFEAATANVAIVEGDILRTPPLGRCLPGVVRAALIEAAPEAGLKVMEEPIRINHLLAADEVVLTNSLIRMRAASEIDGVPVGGRASDRLDSLRAALLRKIVAA